MVIEYGNSKDVKCYRDFVLNPDNRGASGVFNSIITIYVIAVNNHDYNI